MTVNDKMEVKAAGTRLDVKLDNEWSHAVVQADTGGTSVFHILSS